MLLLLSPSTFDQHDAQLAHRGLDVSLLHVLAEHPDDLREAPLLRGVWTSSFKARWACVFLRWSTRTRTPDRTERQCILVLFLRLAAKAGDEVVLLLCAGRRRDLQTLGRSVTSARRLGGVLGCRLVKRTRNSGKRSATSATTSAK